MTTSNWHVTCWNNTKTAMTMMVARRGRRVKPTLFIIVMLMPWMPSPPPAPTPPQAAPQMPTSYHSLHPRKLISLGSLSLSQLWTCSTVLGAQLTESLRSCSVRTNPHPPLGPPDTPPRRIMLHFLSLWHTANADICTKVPTYKVPIKKPPPLELELCL